MNHLPRHRLPMRLSLITLCLGLAAPVWAQSAAAASVPVTVSIPAQPLDKALTALAAQTGMLIGADSSLLAGKQAPAISGTYTPTAALQKLLAGSGLEAVIGSDGSAQLRRLPEIGTDVLPAISVKGQQETAHGPVHGYIATRSATATKTDTALMETPQSIAVITRDRMTVQGAQTVSDGLSYSAGIHANVAGDNPTDNTIIVRGFQQITANAYTDGLKNNQVGYYAPEPYGMERIEVLKGPSSVLYGQGSPGGTVSFVSKRPTFSSHREVGFSVGSHDRLQGMMDIGDVLNEDRSLAYRLVALGRDANSAIDNIKDDRVYIAPSLTWNLDSDTSITLLASYQRNRNLFTTNLPYSVLDGSNPNGKVPRNRSLNVAGFDIETAEQTDIGYQFSHNLNENWTVNQNFRYSNYNGVQNALHRNSGVIGDTTIARYYQMRDYASDNYALDNQLIGKFFTGKVSHTVLVGADYQDGVRKTFTQTGNAPSINIYNPEQTAVIDTSQYTGRSDTRQKNRQLGFYLQDQIKWDKWVATLAGRYDWSRQATFNQLAGTRVDTNAQDFMGRAALGYSFENGVFPYFSYAESFTPTSGTDINGSRFDPETAKQYELGVKYQPSGSENYVTASVFDLRRQNVLTPNPQNTSFSVQEGEVASKGVELEAVLKPLKNMNVIAAYTYNDVEVTKDNPNAGGVSNKGKVPVRVPAHLVSLWADYVMPVGEMEGLTIGAGARYTGSTYGDAQNTFKVPGYTLFDAMISYDFGRVSSTMAGLSAAVNIKNLTDRYYVAGCFLNNACLLGAGRSVIATINYKW